MVEVVGVRFKQAGKIYYFSSGDLALDANDKVIVETARGVEFGELVIPPRQVKDEEVVLPLKPVLRKASLEDQRIVDENKIKEKEAFQICLKKIIDHQLPMKLVDVEYTFDGNKIIFSFTAEGRVDFRELVKDLASVFRTRIELRQIGVRDEAKMLGGVGSCGRILCCSSFLGDFEPVSIRMAKDQKLSLNPTKISGICGRLMCCLKYENSAYDEENKANCRENCRGNCRDQRDDIAESTENDAEPIPNQEIPVAGKGRHDVRQKKGEKYKGKSEKV
jgi:cell fate regulator YaaT (PSP1 superfamily)